MARRLVRVVSWLLTLGVTALVAAAVLVPRLGGATPYTVLTGSMAPALPPGALVVVRPVDIDDVRVGDVVTFQLRSGDPAVATHRVVGVGWSGGERVLTTRGDANGATDLSPVREVQLKGSVWYSLPWVGHLNVLMTPAQRELLVRIAAGLLFLYAAAVLVRGWRARSGPPAAPTASPGQEPRPVPEVAPRPARSRSGAHARRHAGVVT